MPRGAWTRKSGDVQEVRTENCSEMSDHCVFGTSAIRGGRMPQAHGWAVVRHIGVTIRKTMSRLFLFLAAISGALSVGLGAFAAHGLKNRIDGRMLEVFQTGVSYQSTHSLALLAVALLALKWPASSLQASGFLFIAGILLFSGSLYGLALGGPRWLGPITPLGGLSFIGGWLALAWFALRNTELGA